MTRSLLYGAALLAAVTAVNSIRPADVAAQRRPSAMRQGPGETPRLGERLLERRSELRLTDDQVKRIEAIQKTYAARIEPLARQLREAREAAPIRRLTPAERDSLSPAERRKIREQHMEEMAKYREAHPELEEARRKLHLEMTSARDELMAVLTPEQRTMVRERMRSPRHERGPRGDRRGR